jgi:hypothetical protein
MRDRKEQREGHSGCSFAAALTRDLARCAALERETMARAGLKFPNRFREGCPETGKKADLMFVQHMLASLKSDGHMATILPHGVAHSRRAIPD